MKNKKFDLIKGKSPEKGELIMTDTLHKVTNRKRELETSWKGKSHSTERMLHIAPSETGHKFKAKPYKGEWTNYNSPQIPLVRKKK